MPCLRVCSVVALASVIATGACGAKVVLLDDDAGSGGGSSTTATASGTTSTSSGTGGCAAPTVDCGGQCVDVGADPANCGECFQLCPEGHDCNDGNCTPFACVSVVEAESMTAAGWATAFGNVLHGGAGLETLSDDSTASLQLTLAGAGVVMYTERGPNRGDLQVQLDDEPPITIEGYLDDFAYQVPTIVSTTLGPGAHTLRVQCLPASGYCGVDYFAIVCDRAPP